MQDPRAVDQGESATETPPESQLERSIRLIVEALTDEDIRTFQATTAVTTLAAFTIGGLASCRPSIEAFREANKDTRFRNQFMAQRGLNDAILGGFAREGARLGWRVGLFTAGFSAISLGLEKHRGERDVLNLVAAGAACGGMFGAFGGPKKLLVSAATGSGLSLGYGMVLQSLWWVEDAIMTEEEKKARVAAKAALPRPVAEASAADGDHTKAPVAEASAADGDHTKAPVVDDPVGDMLIEFDRKQKAMDKLKVEHSNHGRAVKGRPQGPSTVPSMGENDDSPAPRPQSWRSYFFGGD